MAVVHHPAVAPPPRPVVSVCIANYNGERLLVDCIGSVLAQDAEASVEVIVHDDASSDGSVALLCERFPQVEVLASDENVGFCIANNRMVAHARGEFVLLLNNDAALFPDAVATLLALARGLPDPAILTLPQYDWESGALVDRGCMIDPFYNPVPNTDVTWQDVAYVIGACLWIPRAGWEGLGGFPEWMGSIGEDMYLCCHARLCGWQVKAAATSGYRHRQGLSFGGNRVEDGRLRSTFRRRALSERNKTFALYVMTPGPMCLLLAVHLVGLFMEGWLLALANRDPTIWSRIYRPAMAAIVRYRKMLSAQRAQIQAKRVITLRRYFSTTRLAPRKLSLLWRHGLPRVD